MFSDHEWYETMHACDREKSYVSMDKLIHIQIAVINITPETTHVSIYTLSDLGVLSNLIGSLSLANEHYSPPTE